MKQASFSVAATGAAVAYQTPMREVNWLAEHFPEPAQQREYAREKCVEAVAARLDHLMEQAQISQAALAEKLGKSPSQISKILSGAHNMTLHTLGDVLWACGRELQSLQDVPLGIVEVSLEDERVWATVNMNTESYSRSPSNADTLGGAASVNAPTSQTQ